MPQHWGFRAVELDLPHLFTSAWFNNKSVIGAGCPRWAAADNAVAVGSTGQWWQMQNQKKENVRVSARECKNAKKNTPQQTKANHTDDTPTTHRRPLTSMH